MPPPSMHALMCHRTRDTERSHADPRECSRALKPSRYLASMGDKEDTPARLQTFHLPFEWQDTIGRFVP